MRVLFLDVDGVLNSVITRFALAHAYLGQSASDERLRDENVLALKMIFEQVEDLRIVLSSTWKYLEAHMEELRNCLCKHGIFSGDQTFLSHTPDLRDAGPGFPKENSHSTRTDEILLWIKINSHNPNVKHKEHLYPLPRQGEIGGDCFPCAFLLF